MDFVERDLKKIAVEDNQVGGFADFDGSGFSLLKIQICAVDGVGGEHRFEIDNFFWQPCRAGFGRRAAAGHCHLDRFQRIHGRDGPVATSHDHRSSVGNASNRIEPPRAFWTENRERHVDDVWIGPRPQRLKVRNNAKLAEPGDVGGGEQLNVRDMVA